MKKQTIAPCLWFNGNAEEAMNFYTSIFKDSKILSVTHYGDVGPGKKGELLTGLFEVNGLEILVLNGGPAFAFTPAISLSVACENQEEVDYYWEKLTANGGEEDRCGWLKDKYGVSWQIVPNAMIKMLQDKDEKKSNRAMQAMMKMNKIDIKTIEAAFNLS